MSQFLLSILGFILAIGILVSIHEFGHFWVARRFGIKVIRFSIGFGRPLFRWYDKLGTEYVLASIPLGGYVQMLGEQDIDVPQSERPMAYSLKPTWVRMLVLLAGPGFNLIFAVLMYWIVFFSGISVMIPLLGNIPEGSPAYVAGLKSGQEIVAVEGEETKSWEEVHGALLSHLGETPVISIDVRNKNQQTVETHHLDLSHLAGEKSEGDILDELGIVPLDVIPPIIGEILPDYPAAKAGLAEGDKILSVNGTEVHSRIELSQYIQSHLDDKLTIVVLRGEAKQTFLLSPMIKKLEDGRDIGFIGVKYVPPILPPQEYMHIEKYGAGQALVKALQQTKEYSLLSLSTIKKMIMGTISSKYINGPVAIAKFAGRSVSFGFEYFLSFLAMISISLAIINLLPIPLLDGGNFMYCLWEMVTGKIVSFHVRVIGAWIGALFIIGITLLALYNDLIRF